MSKFLDKLNKEQKRAAKNTKGPLAIIAGAGSGKTRTIAHKISYMIEEVGVPAYRMLALTFTNKAAEEMRDRLELMIGEKAKKTTTTTFHSLCARILKIEHKTANLPQNFNILDNIDQRAILSPIYKKYDLSPKTHSYNSTISYISKNKMSGNAPDYLIDKSVSDSDKIIASIYRDYQETVKRIKSVDFDDLLLLTLKLFNDHKDCAQKWSDKYDYVLVDEFQDTSLVQYEIVKHLAKHNNITIVGDPDQTIYTWRQAHVELINNFKKYFKGAKIIKLEENYRSTQNILKAANKLISHNTKRIEKNLFTSREEGDIIDFNHAFSDDSEARYIVQTINRLRKERTQLKDVAILYRANYQSNALERALINENLNYVIYGGVKFYQRQEVKDALAYLKIIASNDEVSMRRMINIPSRKIGKVAQSK
ncbi:MAG: UvrD-helicase domain-containing protein, partial [Mycoplasmataceae bacterium]|nr:UvrD-helicase domain-containing protein [Mycoplasmataceae bacterium]